MPEKRLIQPVERSYSLSPWRDTRPTKTVSQHQQLEISKRKGTTVSDSRADRNKTIVLESFEALFNKRNYVAAERFWLPNYIQHSAHIGPGRDGLFNLIKGIPSTLTYEPGMIVGEGDFVIIHGWYSSTGLPANFILADIIRMKDGVLVEHSDVIGRKILPGMA